VLYLVRHAEAGDKRAWTGPDVRRPLTDVGWRQAQWLAGRLDGHQVTTIVSSPAVRCVQTVDTIAHRRALEVRTDARLYVDADPDEATKLLQTAEPHTVWCTHGELIGEILSRLRAAGAPIGDAPEWVKGSLWWLDLVAGQVRRATYHPPG
jgi:8-oxo-dGTP diphosphatase